MKSQQTNDIKIKKMFLTTKFLMLRHNIKQYIHKKRENIIFLCWWLLMGSLMGASSKKRIRNHDYFVEREESC